MHIVPGQVFSKHGPEACLGRPSRSGFSPGFGALPWAQSELDICPLWILTPAPGQWLWLTFDIGLCRKGLTDVLGPQNGLSRGYHFPNFADEKTASEKLGDLAYVTQLTGPPVIFQMTGSSCSPPPRCPTHSGHLQDTICMDYKGRLTLSINLPSARCLRPERRLTGGEPMNV